MNLTETPLTKNYIFRGKIINLRVDDALLPNGAVAQREIVEHNGGVCVVPLDREENVYLVEQFRYPYAEVVMEIPAGKRDGDEDPLVCGKRELKEEIGATAGRYLPLGCLYPSPGYCGEIITMYLATDLTFGDCNPDDDEFLNLKKMPLSQAVELVMAGKLRDAKTQAALLKVWCLKQQGKL